MFLVPKPTAEKQGKLTLSMSLSSRASARTATTATSSYLQDADDLSVSSFANATSYDWDSVDAFSDNNDRNEFLTVLNQDDTDEENGGDRGQQGRLQKNRSNSRCGRRRQLVDTAVGIALSATESQGLHEKEKEKSSVASAMSRSISLPAHLSLRRNSNSLENLVTTRPNALMPLLSRRSLDSRDLPRRSIEKQGSTLSASTSRYLRQSLNLPPRPDCSLIPTGIRRVNSTGYVSVRGNDSQETSMNLRRHRDKNKGQESCPKTSGIANKEGINPATTLQATMTTAIPSTPSSPSNALSLPAWIQREELRSSRRGSYKSLPSLASASNKKDTEKVPPSSDLQVITDKETSPTRAEQDTATASTKASTSTTASPSLLIPAWKRREDLRLSRRMGKKLSSRPSSFSMGSKRVDPDIQSCGTATTVAARTTSCTSTCSGSPKVIDGSITPIPALQVVTNRDGSLTSSTATTTTPDSARPLPAWMQREELRLSFRGGYKSLSSVGSGSHDKDTETVSSSSDLQVVTDEDTSLTATVTATATTNTANTPPTCPSIFSKELSQRGGNETSSRPSSFSMGSTTITDDNIALPPAFAIVASQLLRQRHDSFVHPSSNIPAKKRKDSEVRKSTVRASLDKYLMEDADPISMMDETESSHVAVNQGKRASQKWVIETKKIH